MDLECYIWRNEHLLFKKEDIDSVFRARKHTSEKINIIFNVYCDMSNSVPVDFFAINQINKTSMPIINELCLDYDWQGFNPLFEKHFNYTNFKLNNVPEE